MREIVHLRAAQSHALEQCGHPLAPLSPRQRFVNLEGLTDDIAGALARIERRERVLENDLQLPAVRPEFGLAEARDVMAVEPDGPSRRLDQAHDGAPHRGLAAARLADEPQRLAGADREAHAVHGVDDAGRGTQYALAARA